MARLSRETSCTAQIVPGRYGPELQIFVRLPEPRLENEGMKVTIIDEEIHLEDEVSLCDVLVKPNMKLSITAEIPTLLKLGVKRRRALQAARDGSPILS